MAALPEPTQQPFDKPSLVAATALHAPIVASWIATAQEALWTAPQTAPPITTDNVLAWISAAARPRALVQDETAPADGPTPRLLGYGELNPFDTQPDHWWIGHVIVDPALRGRGLGREIATGLRELAFGELGATKVTLVAFPANIAARRAYAAAGFAFDGYETHLLRPYDRREVMVRMVARR